MLKREAPSMYKCVPRHRNLPTTVAEKICEMADEEEHENFIGDRGNEAC